MTRLIKLTCELLARAAFVFTKLAQSVLTSPSALVLSIKLRKELDRVPHPVA